MQRWKRDNILGICSNLHIRNPRTDWSYRKRYAKVVRRGKRLANGDMLWMEGGRLYVEKANSDVAQ